MRAKVPTLFVCDERNIIVKESPRGRLTVRWRHRNWAGIENYRLVIDRMRYVDGADRPYDPEPFYADNGGRGATSASVATTGFWRVEPHQYVFAFGIEPHPDRLLKDVPSFPLFYGRLEKKEDYFEPASLVMFADKGEAKAWARQVYRDWWAAQAARYSVVPSLSRTDKTEGDTTLGFLVHKEKFGNATM